MERHPALVSENGSDGCFTCQNGTGNTPQTCRWRKETGAPPPEPAPPLPRTPLVPAGDIEGAQSSEIKGVPPGYVYILTPLPNPQLFNLDTYAKECKCDENCILDLLTE